jgi:xyloglucan-specific exo-beta-1,4-glucanase
MKLKYGIVALAVLSAASFQPLTASAQTVTSASYSWRNVEINGGGFITGIVYHPTQWGLAYARTDIGGAYRWDAVTRTWTPLNDQLGPADAQLMGILSVAVDPANSNQVYLAAGEYTAWWARNAAILRSSDRGMTWSRTELPFKLGGNEDGRSTGERLQVDPNKGSILFLGTSNDGLWKSVDGAQTWTKVTSFPAASVTFVLFDKRAGNSQTGTSTLYVGVNSTSGASLYRSTDGGNSWSALTGQPTGLIPHHAGIDGNGLLYLTYSNLPGPSNITNGAVWRYDTNTGVWRHISPVVPGYGGWDNFGYGGLAVDPLRPGTLMVATYDRWGIGDDIFRSADGGMTWKALGAKAQLDSSSAPWVPKRSGSMGHWMGAIAIDPFNSNYGMYVTGIGLWHSTNLMNADNGQGTTWAFANKGIEETAVLELSSPPSGAPLLSALGDIDGFYHSNLNNPPARAFNNPNGNSAGIDYAQSAPGIVVRTNAAASTRGYRSIDGGNTWTAFGSAPQPAIDNGPGRIAVSSNGAAIVWMPYRSGAWYSRDNGLTWQQSSGSPNDGQNNFAPVADRSNPSKFYVYNQAGGQVHRSIDGGATFTLAAEGLPTWGGIMRQVPGAAFEGHLWLPTPNGLYRSINAGATFSPVTGVQKATAVGFGMAAAGQTHPAVYIIGTIAGVHGFYRSDNAGVTWVRINDANRQFSDANLIIGDPRVHGRAYVGTNGRGILYGEPTGTVSTAASPS